MCLCNGRQGCHDPSRGGRVKVTKFFLSGLENLTATTTTKAPFMVQKKRPSRWPCYVGWKKSSISTRVTLKLVFHWLVTRQCFIRPVRNNHHHKNNNKHEGTQDERRRNTPLTLLDRRHRCHRRRRRRRRRRGHWADVAGGQCNDLITQWRWNRSWRQWSRRLRPTRPTWAPDAVNRLLIDWLQLSI